MNTDLKPSNSSIECCSSGSINELTRNAQKPAIKDKQKIIKLTKRPSGVESHFGHLSVFGGRGE